MWPRKSTRCGNPTLRLCCFANAGARRAPLTRGRDWSGGNLRAGGFFKESAIFVLKSEAGEQRRSAPSDFVLFLCMAAGGLLQVAEYSLFRWQ